MHRETLAASSTEPQRVASDQGRARDRESPRAPGIRSYMLTAEADLLRTEDDRTVAAEVPTHRAVKMIRTARESMQRFLIAVCLAGCLPPAAAQKTTSLADFSSAPEHLAAVVAPAVVQVQVSAWCGPAGAAEDVANLAACRVVGSGVIVDPDGYIITNEHVVRNARRIRVMLTPKPEHASDRVAPLLLNPAAPAAEPQLDAVIPGANREPAGKRQVLEAVVLGTNHDADLALLKIPASGLPVIPLQQKGKPPRQGQVVLAVGSPEGLDNTMTIGIVSAVDRQPNPDFPMLYIQTDAAINPGNSGGPLLDVEGELVGINSFIISESGRNQGLGFAVPAAVVRYVYEQLRSNGFVRYCMVGVRVQTVTPGIAQGLGLSRGYGVMIADVVPRSPADSAGLRPRDIIAAVDGATIWTVPFYNAMMYLHDPTIPVAVTALRGNQVLNLQVPPVPTDDQDIAIAAFDPVNSLVPQLGIFARTLTVSLALRTGLRSDTGIYVVATTAGNQDASTGLAPGDVIASVNGVPVLSMPEFRRTLDALTPGKPAVLEVERQRLFLYVERELEKGPPDTDMGRRGREESKAQADGGKSH